MDSWVTSSRRGGRPTLGLTGTIGAGKSTVARMLKALGWCVSDSDALARETFEDQAVIEQVRKWWGPAVLAADGSVNRARVAAIVFPPPGASPAELAGCASQRAALEELIHPWIHNRRQLQFDSAPANAPGFVIDAPLLLETGLEKECSIILFVDAPLSERLRRVRASRGWDADELVRRESTQMPLDQKRKMAHHVIVNDADLESLRARVARIHSRITEGQ